MKQIFTTILILLTLQGQAGIFAQEIPRTLYVLNGLGRTVSKMNLETMEITNNLLTVGVVPNRIHAQGDKVYVVNSVPASITVIDGVTDSIINTINLTEGSNPWDMAFVGTEKAYVTSLIANSVTVLDLVTGDSLNSIDVGIGPQGVLVVNNTAYVANTGGFPSYAGSSVSVIDIRTNQVTKTLNVPTNPQAFALSPDGKIHVICTGNFVDIFGQVAVINPFGDSDFTAIVTDTIAIGGSPGDIKITTDGTAYVADFGDGSNGFLYSYNAQTLAITNDSSNPILVGSGAMNLFFDEKTRDLYVNNFSNDAVQLLDASNGSVLNTFTFGEGAQNMAILEPISASTPWADAVVSFTPGDGAGFGQNFFPANVLGPPDPDPTLSSANPSSKPQELLSLGHGGEIILEMNDNFIVDGDGVDFTVFENAFFFNGVPFVEAAYVAVSMDGQNWVEFPWDTTTFEGFAGVTPTEDNQNPTDPEVSGGDSFDLADVGLPYARFVKLTDIGDLKQEGSFNGDFDLDAVVAVNSSADQPTSVRESSKLQPEEFTLAQNYPNPFNPSTNIAFTLPQAAQVTVEIFNNLGQKVTTLISEKMQAGVQSISWNAAGQASGVYLYSVRVGDFVKAGKMILLK